MSVKPKKQVEWLHLQFDKCISTKNSIVLKWEDAEFLKEFITQQEDALYAFAEQKYNNAHAEKIKTAKVRSHTETIERVKAVTKADVQLELSEIQGSIRSKLTLVKSKRGWSNKTLSEIMHIKEDLIIDLVQVGGVMVNGFH